MNPWIIAALFALCTASAMQPPPPRPQGVGTSPAPLPSATPIPLPPPFEIPEDTRLFHNNPEAGGVTISPSDGKIEEFSTFSVSFPADIVPPEKIDAEGAESPVVAWPPLDGVFHWRSPAQGDWQVTGPRIPGQTYRFRLREGLQALDGSPLPVSAWGAEFSTAPLAVSTWYEERQQLNSRPVVPLEFNAPVRICDVAEGLWFQDRSSRKRFPAEIAITGEEKSSPLPTPTTLRATPREPLPAGAAYELVVEDVRDAYAGRTLPYPRVFPLGTTRPLEVDYVAARNWTTDKPHLEIKFTANLSDAPLPANAVKVEPPVAGLAFRIDGETLLVAGAFDTKTRYKVTVSRAVTGDRGFPLAADSVWGATFQPKPPTILFPPGDLRQRGALGLRFALVQSNTGPLRWQLARIPREKLTATLKAVAEGIREGAPLLVDSLGLDVAGSGDFPAVDGDREELRKIECKPTAELSGPYLLEASADAGGGRKVANRSLVWFGDLVLTQKLSPDTLTLRAARMGDGLPAENVGIRLLTADLLEVASATTDSSGLASFSRTSSNAASFFETALAGKTSLWPATTDAPFPSGSTYLSPRPSVLGKILTDRPLYRPGQEVRVKGFVRTKNGGRLEVPEGRVIKWEIAKGWQNDVVASGAAKVSPEGGWDAAWVAPEGADLGEFRVRAKLGAADAGNPALFRMEEFRNPPFSVTCEVVPPGRSSEAVLRISSRYFHGAPNAGGRVKWKATWLSDHEGGSYFAEDSDGFTQVDLYSRGVKEPVFESASEGETALDGNGQATVTVAPPFPDPGNRADATVIWQVDITGPDGQTLTGGATDHVKMNDVALGVKPAEPPPAGAVRFVTRAVPRVAGSAVPPKIPVSLFLVKAKSVKEQLAPFVYRYRTFDDFIRLAEKEAPANGTLEFPAKEPGRYVLVAGPVAGGMQVSAEEVVTGPGESEFPVRSDETLQIVGPKEPVSPGSKAGFDIIAPSGGIAWITVECDRILDSRTADLPGNASHIEIPIRESFAPNAFATVYLLRPGRGDRIPGEMFGFAEFKVSDPSKVLDVLPRTGKPAYEPREKVAGSVVVTNGGNPVAGAEVTVYAVDDAILTLGGWALPDLAEPFFPQNTFNILTFPALHGLSDGVSPSQLTQKGYTVGDGGGDAFGNVEFTRKDFKPLLFWIPNLKTDERGAVAFETVAPDNLTRFRVVALAQTRSNQFGAASSTFEVSKKLLVEPALPRFLREGDEVVLRAVARQNLGARETLAVRCSATGLSSQGQDHLSLTADKGAPAVASFPAQVAAGATSATIRFDVVSAGADKSSDSVEVTIPVLPRSILVEESVAGKWTGDTFPAGDFMPAGWKDSRGTFDATLSTSPQIAQLMGLPAVLDYPHGCLEQQSSRILAFTALADLLKDIPTNKARDENYRRAILDSLKVLEASLLPDNQLPYWPMGTAGNPFVTIQSALAVALAEEAGMDVPSRLAGALPEALHAMLGRTLKVSPSLRAFALFALAQIEPGPGLEQTADDLYLDRDKLTNEGKAWLALACARLHIAPEKQRQLAGELPSEPGGSFDPLTFASPARTEAICLLARATVGPTGEMAAPRSRLERLMESSASLSTQENLWLLLAFKELVKSRPLPALAKGADPAPQSGSPNKSAAEWSGLPLAGAESFRITGLGQSADGSFVLTSHRQLGEDEILPTQQGIRIDRLVKDVTDPSRKGTPDAPFRLGDELLVTYRFQSPKPQNFLALEDALPAGIEVLNPNLALFGKAYSIADEPGVSVAGLSHSEMRDSRTDLFFDDVPAGLHSYTVLARATAAGSFAWPSAKISPMYDSRTYARCAPSRCVVRAE